MLLKSCGSQGFSFGELRDRRMDAGVPRHHGILISALLSVIEALLLHGETCPVTGLPARATSAASDFFRRKISGGERRIAVSGQTPNSMEGLCLRCPHSLFPKCIYRLTQIERGGRLTEWTDPGWFDALQVLSNFPMRPRKPSTIPKPAQ